MSELYILMVGVFVSYVTFITLSFGLLPSISESWYRLPRKRKWLFTIFCWGFAVPAMIIGGDALMFIAGAGIAFVGAATAFKESMTKTVHFSGAAIGILAGSAWVAIHYWPLAAIFLLLALGSLALGKYKLMAIELLAFLEIAIGLGVKTFN